MKYTF